MIDVFLRSKYTQDRLRTRMYDLCTSRWELEKVKLHTFWDAEIRTARLHAESLATSDPYIFCDDDVLIMGQNWIERATSVLLAHPEYAIASTLSVIEGENMAKGEGDIYEMHSVGAPMIIRKGTCRELPEMTLDSECGVLHKYVLDMGKKEGLITGIRHNHLGHGFSSNPILRWAY